MKLMMLLNLDVGVTDEGASELSREIVTAILEDHNDDVLSVEVTIENHKPHLDEPKQLRLRFEKEDE